MGNFIEVSIGVLDPVEENADIITAFLSELAFDTFQTEGNCVKAYAREGFVTDEQLSELKEKLAPFSFGDLNYRVVEKENWNALWETNYFEPVVVGNRVRLRASFQDADPNVEYDLVIQPKMSFGTGHHSTTQLMLQLILELEDKIRGKNILDMGAGTGVLAIMAEKLGANYLDAIDIEEWAAANIEENAQINQCNKITAWCGDARLLVEQGKKYDVIFANIHKSVLLQDAQVYMQHLLPGGTLFLSGFYEEDLADIRHCYEHIGCTYLVHHVLKQWCAAVFER